MDVRDVVSRDIIQPFVNSAKERGLALHSEAIAVVAQSDLVVIGAPLAGAGQLDIQTIVKGQALVDLPIMYWYLSGDVLDDAPLPLRDSYYTVVADQERATANLTNNRGEIIANGDLTVCIDPQPPATTVVERVTGKITSVSGSAWPPHIKVCGEFTIKEKGVTVKVTACISAGW